MQKIFQMLAQLEVPLPRTPADADRLDAILNVVYAVSGSMAVLVIVIAGFRYIVSQGDPNSVASSKNAIIYSLVGLVVITTAFAIVKFVTRGLG